MNSFMPISPFQIGVRDSFGLIRIARSQAGIASSKRPSRSSDEQRWWYEVGSFGKLRTSSSATANCPAQSALLRR